MSLGLDPELFWNSTPREVEIIAAGANERLRLDHNSRVTAVYIASPIAFAKERPALSKLLITKSGARRRMTRQEIKETMLIAFPPGKKRKAA